MTNKNFSFGEAFSAGWQKLKENWLFIIGAYIIILLSSGLFSYLSEGPFKDIEPTSGLLALLGLLIRIWLNFNLLVITIRLFEGVEPRWADLFFWRSETISYVGASILYGLMVGFGILFFIFPGIYFAIKYQFYGFLIADKKMGAIEALKASARMTDGVKWLLIGFTVACFGLTLLGILAFFVGLLVALPVISLALVFVYRTLYAQTDFTVEEKSVAPAESAAKTETPSESPVKPVETPAAEKAATTEPETKPAENSIEKPVVTPSLPETKPTDTVLAAPAALPATEEGKKTGEPELPPKA